MLRGAEIPLPQSATRIDFPARFRTETETPPIIYYAGGSPKRKAFLQTMASAEGRILLPVSGGSENNGLDPIEIAGGKIDHAIARLKASGELDSNSTTRSVFIAADVQSHASTLQFDGGGGKIVLATSGKLANPHEVRGIFRGMISSVNTLGDKRHYGYTIEAGSESRRLVGAKAVRIERDANFFYVALEQEAVENFATAEGTKTYLGELNRFLRSREYLSEIEEPGSPAEIAGALDLSVLEKLGAVRKINQTHREDPGFDKVLEAALFAVHVGFDASVLQEINPNAKDFIGNWSWLQRVRGYAANVAA